MSTNEGIHDDVHPSYIAGAALNVYTAVKHDTARNTIVAATASSDSLFVGIMQQTVASGEPAHVKTSGRSLALVGAGDWTKGCKLTPWTSGTLVKTTTAGHYVVAIAEEAATATEYAEVTILPVPVLYSALA